MKTANKIICYLILLLNLAFFIPLTFEELLSKPESPDEDWIPLLGFTLPVHILIFTALVALEKKQEKNIQLHIVVNGLGLLLMLLFFTFLVSQLW